MINNLRKTREIRCQILDNNSLTVNGLQSKIWHLVSDVFLKEFVLTKNEHFKPGRRNLIITKPAKLFLVLCACWLVTPFATAQTLKYINTKNAQKKLDIKSFGDKLSRVYSDSAVGWALTIWKNGKPLYDKSGGFKITPSDYLDSIGLPFLLTTKIHVASLSKTITAIAIAKLVDQKKLNWNDKVKSFLPSYWRFHPIFEDLTILELLSMKSGIDGPLDALSSKTDSLRRIMEKGPNPDKRGKFNYSNTSYGLLRIIIAYASGYKELQPSVDSLVVGIITANLYKEYVNKYLFEPAGINSANCEITDKEPALQYPFPYDNEAGELTGTSKYLENGNLSEYAGGFGWYLSSIETAKFINATFVKKNILSKDSLKGLFNIGFPFRIRRNLHGEHFGSGGDWGHPIEGKGWRGIHAYYYCFPEDIVVTLFVNSGEGSPTKRVISAYEASFQ
jgi:Beta-lactamase